jgi:hypothetical protein
MLLFCLRGIKVAFKITCCRYVYVPVFPNFSFWSSWSIVTKLGRNVTPLKNTLTPHFSIFSIDNANMADARTCQAGARLTPFTLETWNSWQYNLEKYATFLGQYLCSVWKYSVMTARSSSQACFFYIIDEALALSTWNLVSRDKSQAYPYFIDWILFAGKQLPTWRPCVTLRLYANNVTHLERVICN